jgi:tetratricopeptide (TPR) repeat protein
MKKITILIFLVFNGFANLFANEANIETPDINPISTPVQLEFQAVKSQQQLQRQSITNLEKQLSNSDKYYDLRKSVLDSQENSITWWLSFVGIFLTTFGVVGFFVAKDKIKKFKQLNKEGKDELNKIKELNAKAKNEIKELNAEAKNILEQIKKHEKSAEKHEKTISDMAYNASRNPESKMTAENNTEIEKYGTRLDKMFAKIHQLNNEDKYEDAIVLSNKIITIAEYEKDNEQLSNGYFYLGYSYSQLGLHKPAIEAYQQTIKIYPNNGTAYSNIFETQLITNQPFDVDLVKKYTQFDN